MVSNIQIYLQIQRFATIENIERYTTTSEGNFKIYIGKVSRNVSDSDIISMHFTTSSVQKTPTQFSQPNSDTASSVKYS